MKVYWARIGFSDRLVAAANETMALKTLGLKRADKTRTKFKQWTRLDGYRPWNDALAAPGLVFKRLAGRTSDGWKRMLD